MVVICQVLSPLVTVPWDPETQGPLASRPSNQGVFPGKQPQKSGHQMHTKAAFQEILVLWSVAVCVKMVPAGYTKAKGEYKDGEKREMVPTSLHLLSVSPECSNRL